jgi:urease accessory protein UreF
MARQSSTKMGPAFTAELAKLQPALDAWRKRRKRREPMPEPLWRAMVRLARNYRASPVAQALRVNYSNLKRRLQN